jgi:hypothetical protein
MFTRALPGPNMEAVLLVACDRKAVVRISCHCQVHTHMALQSEQANPDKGSGKHMLWHVFPRYCGMASGHAVMTWCDHPTAVCMTDRVVTYSSMVQSNTVIYRECLLHVSTFATTRVAVPTGVKPG